MKKLQQLNDSIKSGWQNARLFFYIIMKGDTDMIIMLYVTLITNGLKSFNDVPALLKDQVKEMLELNGIGNLAQ